MPDIAINMVKSIVAKIQNNKSTKIQASSHFKQMQRQIQHTWKPPQKAW
jgi:hypothetical protein